MTPSQPIQSTEIYGWYRMFSVARQFRSMRRTWRRVAARRLQPLVGMRLMLRSFGKVLYASVTISLVVVGLAVFGLLILVAKSVRVSKRPCSLVRSLVRKLSHKLGRSMPRGLVGRFRWSRISHDQ